jgi:hypothetical protein
MSFPPATEMFQFAGFASASPPIPHNAGGCPIRRSSDQRVLPPPRSLSQGATSFIASRCQGIHQMPFSSLESPRSAIRKHTQDEKIVTRNYTIASFRMSEDGCRMSGKAFASLPSELPPQSATKQTHKASHRPHGARERRQPPVHLPPLHDCKSRRQGSGIRDQTRPTIDTLSSSR